VSLDIVFFCQVMFPQTPESHFLNMSIPQRRCCGFSAPELSSLVSTFDQNPSLVLLRNSLCCSLSIAQRMSLISITGLSNCQISRMKRKFYYLVGTDGGNNTGEVRRRVSQNHCNNCGYISLVRAKNLN
jgi:hypothetical protein